MTTINHIQRTRDLIELGKFDLAAREAQHALAQDPDHYYPHYLLAHSLWKLNKSAEALKVAQEAIRLNPEFAYTYDLLATWGGVDAEVNVQKAIQLLPTEPQFYVHYAVIVHARNWRKAINLLCQALQVDGRCYEAYRFRGAVLNKQEQYADAQNDLLSSLRIFPNDPLALELLGDSYLAVGQAKQSFECYRQALHINPKSHSIKEKITEALEARLPWIGNFWRAFQIQHSQKGKPKRTFASIYVGGWLVILILSAIGLSHLAAVVAFFLIAVSCLILPSALVLNYLVDPILTFAVQKGWIKI